jgi:hypothetical protein
MSSAKKLVAHRRERIVCALAELLTSPQSPISAEDIYHFMFVASNFGTATVLDNHLQEFANHLDLQTEISVAVLVHVLNRLIS